MGNSSEVHGTYLHHSFVNKESQGEDRHNSSQNGDISEMSVCDDVDGRDGALQS